MATTNIFTVSKFEPETPNYEIGKLQNLQLKQSNQYFQHIPKYQAKSSEKRATQNSKVNVNGNCKALKMWSKKFGVKNSRCERLNTKYFGIAKLIVILEIKII